MMSHFYLRTKEALEPKVIISASKKVAKKAVTRNLIKRRVRSIVKELTPNLKPREYIIIAKAGADKVKGKELRLELEELLKLKS